MKKIILALCIAASLAACSKVPAGHVGVKVYLLGGSKGVESEELGVGRYWIGINEELYLFPTFTQNTVWTQADEGGSPGDESISFQTKEGLRVNADFGVSYSIRPDKVTTIFQKYRKGIDEITHLYVRNMVRDALVNEASKLSVEEVYSSGKVALIDAVTADVRKQVSDIGINIEKVYLIGDMRLPQNVIAAINSKIGATQKAQQRENEIREAEAEAAKKVATAKGEAESILMVAKAQADANKLLSESITTTLVNYKSLEKWDGKLPYMTGGGAIPMIQVPSAQ